MIEGRTAFSSAVDSQAEILGRDLDKVDAGNVVNLCFVRLTIFNLFTGFRGMNGEPLLPKSGVTLTTVAGYLLDRHIRSLAEGFEREGGFTERLYRRRTQIRREGN